MLVIPAIDIRRGRCVRLYRGDPGQETVFSDDPVEVARQWEALGARRLHVVDLDGAFSGHFVNAAVIAEIGSVLHIPFQLGGGVRSRRLLENALAAGALRVILGTMIVEQPELAQELAAEFGDRVVAGIDARSGLVAVRGWAKDSPLRAVDLARQVEQWGIREVIYTDIERDGTLQGPNLASLEELIAQTSLDITVAGGISSVKDLHALQQYRSRVKAVIIGQALYTNRFTLAEAMQIAGN